MAFAVLPSGSDTAVYSVIAEPPVLADPTNVTSTVPGPVDAAVTSLGGSGTVVVDASPPVPPGVVDPVGVVDPGGAPGPPACAAAASAAVRAPK